MLSAGPFTPTIVGLHTHKCALACYSRCVRLAASHTSELRQTQVLRCVTMLCWDCRCVQHRVFLESLQARDKRPNRQNQQRIHATLEEDSALQRIEASPRGKSRSGALNRLSKPELQQELRLRGLSDNGKKEALKARLTDSLDLDNPAAGISRDLLYQAAYNLHTTKVHLVEF